MGTDFFFRIGSTHSVCQDYATSGELDGIKFIIGSDGCSSISEKVRKPGAPFTDFGSRFLVRATMLHMDQIAAGHFPKEQIIATASSMNRAAGFENGEGLDATLICAVQTPSGFAAFMSGDGYIATRQRNGKIEWMTRHFDCNAPYYLSYLLNPTRHIEYQKMVSYVLEEHHVADKEDEIISQRCAIDHSKLVKAHLFPLQDIELLLIMSDGVDSFTESDGTPVPVQKVLDQIFAFKNFEGQFIGRRCNRFFNHFCRENGWQNKDDFLVAGIYNIGNK